MKSSIVYLSLAVCLLPLWSAGQCDYESISHFYGTASGVVAPSVSFMDYSPDGTIVIASSYTASDSLNFGNGWTAPTNDGHYGLFITKVNLDGSTVWARTFPGSGFNSIYDLKCDEYGGVYITGINQSFTIDGLLYDGSAVQTFYFGKFESDGEFSWMLHEQQNSSSGQSISVVGESVYVTGTYVNELNLLGQNWTSPTTSNVSFILKVNLAGEFQNIYQFTGEGSDQIFELECTEDNCLLAGLYEQILDFEGQTLGTTSANNAFKYFVANLNLASTTVDWFATSNECAWIQGVHGLHRSDSLVFLSGYFEEPLSFESASVLSNGGRDAFVLKLNSEGQVLDVMSYGGSDNDVILDASITNSGLLVTINYASTDMMLDDAVLPHNGEIDIAQLMLDNELKEQCTLYFGGQGDEDFWSSLIIDNEVYVVGSTNSNIISFESSSFITLGERDLTLLKTCLPCDTLTSIAETISAQPILFIYPNPANQSVRIQVEGNSQQVYAVEVIDMLGHAVLHQRLAPTDQQIDISNLANGIYTIAAIMQSGETLRQRLVVQH